MRKLAAACRSPASGLAENDDMSTPAVTACRASHALIIGLMKAAAEGSRARLICFPSDTRNNGATQYHLRIGLALSARAARAATSMAYAAEVSQSIIMCCLK